MGAHLSNPSALPWSRKAQAGKTQTELALARLTAIVESSEDAIYSRTVDGIITDWNPGAERLYGYTTDEVMEKSISLLVPPDHLDEVKSIQTKIRRGEWIAPFETVRKRKDGSQVYVSLAITPLRDRGGNVTSALVIARDLTALKQAEAERQELLRQTLLREDISAALIRVEHLSEMLQRCAQSLVDHLDAAFARIWTLNEAENVLELQASAGMYTHLDGAHSRVSVGSLKIGWIAAERVPHLTNSVVGDPCVSDQEWAKQEGMVSFAGHPLLIEDRLVGVMAMFARKPLSPATIHSLSSIANEIALGIERKRADAALRESERRYRSLFCAVGGGIVVQDRTGAIREANPLACDILGLSAEQVQGRTSLDPRWHTIHEDGSPFPGEEHPAMQTLRTGKPTRNTVIGVYHPGEKTHRWLLVNSEPILDPRTNTAEAAVATFLDISEQKRAQEANRQYAERLKLLRQIDRAMLSAQSLEAIAESTLRHIRQLLPCEQAGVIVFDFGQHRCYPVAVDSSTDEWIWQAGVSYDLQEFGFEEFGALSRGEVYVAEDILALPQPHTKVHALATNGLRSYLEAPLLYQGELIGALCLGSRQTGGFTLQHQGIAVEIADQLAIVLKQVRLQEEVQRQNEKLEKRVAERTAQLEIALRELDAFSYTVSHDLRAPLRAIEGFSRILMEEYLPELNPDAQRYLTMVRQNTLQMSHLVDDLLAFSRLSRQAIQKQTVALAPLVEETLYDLRIQNLETTGRKMQFDIGDLPDCQGDRALLKQVFLNLLSNAIKFTRTREEARIEVGSMQPQDSTSPVYFVRDNGVGFDMKYVHKLFRVFQRLHRAEDFEGTGVGLAIVQRIVHRHGGQVWAEAAPDQGATFYFMLEGNNPS